MKKLLLLGTLALSLAVPFGVSESESGNLSLRFNDACADNALCTNRPNQFCNGVNGKWEIKED